MGLITIIEPSSEPVSLDDMKLFLRVDESNTMDDALIGSLILAARRWAEVYTQRRFVRQTLRLLMDFFPGYIDQKLVGQNVSSPFVSGANAVLVGIRYAMRLPCPPIHDIAAFNYLDVNGATTAMVEGTNYVADLASQPARLMPVFGQMWPVARVIANAVIVDYVVGYGGNITVGAAAASKLLSGHVFSQMDVGSPISIPGAGTGNTLLSGFIASVDGSGVATLASPAATTVTGAVAYLGQPVPEMIGIAIKLLVGQWYENRMPDENGVSLAVKSILAPYRDLRL